MMENKKSPKVLSLYDEIVNLATTIKEVKPKSKFAKSFEVFMLESEKKSDENKLLIDTTKALAKYVRAYDYVIEKNIINELKTHIYFYPTSLDKPDKNPDDSAVVINGYLSVIPDFSNIDDAGFNVMIKKVVFDINNPYELRVRKALFLMPEELNKLKRKLNIIRTKTKIDFLRTRTY